MRALVTRLRPDGMREKREVDDWSDAPHPVGNQVKTRTLYSGITNGTEHNDLIGGNWAHPDEVLPAGWGYQNVGEVVELGPQVEHLRPGDLLYMSVDHVEHAVVPEDGLLIALPPEVDPVHAALFGMASVAMRTCRNAELQRRERVLVVGAGFIGQMAAQIARTMEAIPVICDVDQARLDLATEIGAVGAAFNSAGAGWRRNVPDASFDAVLDMAGADGMVDPMLMATRPRGRVLLIAGRWRVDYTFNLGQHREITIKQNSHFDRYDLAALCDLVAMGEVRIGPLVRDVVSVKEAPRIYDTLRDRPQELLGTVFDWR